MAVKPYESILAYQGPSRCVVNWKRLCSKQRLGGAFDVLLAAHATFAIATRPCLNFTPWFLSGKLKC